MIFVRTGPRFLFLRTEDKVSLSKKLVEILGGEVMTLNTAIGKAEENNTIIFLASPKKDSAIMTGRNVILIPLGSSVTLARLINEGLAPLVCGAEMGPGMILQRIPHNGQKIIKMLQEQYHGKDLDNLEEAVIWGKADDTVVCFIEEPLNRSVSLEKILSPVLVVNDYPMPKLFRDCRQRAVRYFTEGLEGGEWHEVRINIYDAAEEYDIHYKRLVSVLEDLEAGLILGEAWTKDHALSLFSVVAYQVRLFTALEPLELKEVLAGLEYDFSGNRIVDMDLYHRRKKISRYDIVKHKFTADGGYGSYFRKKLFSRISEEAKKKLLELEEKLQE